MSAFLRQYATAWTVTIPIIKRAVVDFAVSADWTPAAGDVKVSIDGGAAVNIGTLPTAVTMGNTAYWKFVGTTGEATGKIIIVTVGDSATKAVEDQAFVIETYGHASALHALNLNSATVTVGAMSADVVTASALAADAVAEVGTYMQAEHGTAQAGASGTITLAAGASATNSYYSGRGAIVFIRSGTGAGQDRPISAYVGSTKVASVTPNWTTAPDNTSVYDITFV